MGYVSLVSGLHRACALQIGSYYRVRFSADPDEPAVLIPSCCVWTENGLCTTPASAATSSAEAAIRQLAGALLDSLLPGLHVSVSSRI